MHLFARVAHHSIHSRINNAKGNFSGVEHFFEFKSSNFRSNVHIVLLHVHARMANIGHSPLASLAIRFFPECRCTSRWKKAYWRSLSRRWSDSPASYTNRQIQEHDVNYGHQLLWYIQVRLTRAFKTTHVLSTINYRDPIRANYWRMYKPNVLLLLLADRR